MSPTSAFGWVLRTVWRMGSSTGLLAMRGPPNRASRARIRSGEDEPWGEEEDAGVGGPGASVRASSLMT